MQFALFHTPFTRPDRTPRQAFDWAVNQAITAEEAGFSEFWVGEHSTLSWEQIPSPELVLAAAAQQTDSIKLCPGAHLLPYHHPATLAAQTSWMSHITQGRYILGLGAGAYPSDGKLHGLSDMSETHPMFLESIEIMEKVWKSEPFHYEGKYWKAGYPEAHDEAWRDLTPYGGEMELAIAGVSQNSPSLRLAGSRGWMPLSFMANAEVIAGHWSTYSDAAAANGIQVDRKRFHVAMEIFVADSDEEARDQAVNGGIGKAWMEYLLPAYKQVGLDKMLGVDADHLTLDFLADNWWVVGSPDTVADQLQEFMEATGGWGTTMVYGHDFIDDPGPWRHSFELLANEVGPRISLPSERV